VKAIRAGGPVRAAHAALLFVLAAALATQPAIAASRAAAQAAKSAGLPARLSDAEFWKLATEISEPGGYFRITDNYTSNEREVGTMFTLLRETGVRGGVYLGVGPEQNFSYIAAIRPAMAFIVDIRRQAVMQHLMFKAVFELSKDRADFIALLFARARPAGLDASASIQKIWDDFWGASTDPATWDKSQARVMDHLTRTHGFALTPEEVSQLESVIQAFYRLGPSITTRGAPAGRGGNGLTFADLTGYSYDTAGHPQSFLVSEDHFRYVKSLHEKNLIVPVSGDFGGPKAIRAIGGYLQGRGATVSAFYVSNVEQYLFQDGKHRAFYDNVAQLPVTETSVFIRPYSLRRGGGATQSLCAIPKFLAAVQAGQIYTNNDALACVK
jgi:hypothetical protein